eukprot:CAMPEP_0201700386 /NCGR_PEP_ID=MMETSP0578-20130828/28253_1 /ASSEMBLY_ACC=CAM_ASM_000663 /TAXON_ID=267565 /ORGANISM="Skeletonema grethea, Strain CCMP 1804" /LENGTH=66 /DNA_ID=CAMNT_0048187417 /DNA_START=78 /DNA_END=275 /DNA_ORIENTATION=-
MSCCGKQKKETSDPTTPDPSFEDPTIHEDYKNFERDPFFAFIPQLGRWGFGILSNEATLVTKGVAS